MVQPAAPRRSTIYDVARRAGVAASTVSRAYALPGRVHPETARRVFAAGEALGYRREPTDGRHRDGRSLTRTIGLVVADVTNPFYGEIIRGAHQAAHEAGYLLTLSHTNESAELERETLESQVALVDGIVIASSRMTDSALRMVAKQAPLVLLNRLIPEVSCVLNDAERGVRCAAEHLHSLGHDSLVYVAGPGTSWADGMRWRGLRQAGVELGIAVRRVGPNEPGILAGYGAARQVAHLGATAVVAYNDALAIGLVKGLRRLGRGVPQDVSVIGFDNVMLDELVEPALTTISAPLYRMGAVAVRNCIALARGAQPSGNALVLPVKLVERASTGVRRLALTSGRAGPGSPTRTTGDATRSASRRSARPPRS
jgi:LacI family transcriptional regulator